MDEMCSYMLKIEVTSKSNTFNRTQLRKKWTDKAALEEDTLREGKWNTRQWSSPDMGGSSGL